MTTFTTFRQWLEMANLFPQRKGDTISRTSTTHMGYPVHSPTIFFIIANRDKGKYPDGMTAQEIGDEILKASTARTELRPGEELAPADWEGQIRGNRTTWGKFVRGINSMLAKSKDFAPLGTRQTGGRGRAPSVYAPTPDATRREGGMKFLKKGDREYWKKARADRPQEETPSKTPAPEDISAVDVPEDLKGKSEEDIAGMIQAMFREE